MKKSALFTQLITAALFTSLVMIACKKEQSDTLSPAEEEQAVNYSTQTETENEVVFNDIFDNVIGVNTEVGIGGTGIFGRIAEQFRIVFNGSGTGRVEVVHEREIIEQEKRAVVAGIITGDSNVARYLVISPGEW